MIGFIHSIIKKNTKKIYLRKNNEKKYFLWILLILFFFSVFYYFFIKYYHRFYFVHYYEEYVNSILIAYNLKSLNFLEFFKIYAWYSPTRLLLVRNIPIYMIFGYSEFFFFYSNVILNLFLVFILYKTLLKIFSAKKSFCFILFIISGYSFIELLASWYTDLTYFFIFSIFFIYLYLYIEKDQQYSKYLLFLTPILFFTRRLSYFLIPSLLLFSILYIILIKKKDYYLIIKLVKTLALGYLVYILIFSFFFSDFLSVDLSEILNKQIVLPGAKFSDVPYRIYARKVFDFNLPFNITFLFNKFRFPLINLFLYLLVIYNLIIKKNYFWIFLFFFSEFSMMFLIKYLGYSSLYRFFLHFYFIYYYFMFNFVFDLLKKYFNKNWMQVYILLICIIFVLNILTLFDKEQNMVYSDTILVDNNIFNLIQNSSVYIDGSSDSELYFYFYIREPISILKKISSSSRFKYNITQEIEKADYVLGSNLTKFDQDNYIILKEFKMLHYPTVFLFERTNN